MKRSLRSSNASRLGSIQPQNGPMVVPPLGPPGGRGAASPLPDEDSAAHEKLRKQLQETTNEVLYLRSLLEKQGKQIESQNRMLNSIEAIRDCWELCNEDDVVSLKQLLYWYREDPQTTVVSPATHLGHDSVDAFTVEWRGDGGRGKKTFGMVSVGGVAIATEYYLACQMFKTKTAANLLLRALGNHLEVNSA